ncbi:hypothetical protein ACFWOJ_37395 [Streptomyces sp. NPDC058439]|uniref:hypothetical protein n=1 Tax=Streptomyces sp. NPDC058439 TaxID=3346500 RepID=UPI003662C47B
MLVAEARLQVIAGGAVPQEPLAESLRAWVKKAKAAEVTETGGNTMSARGSADERDEELKRLRKLTVEQVKTIEILKKRQLSSRRTGQDSWHL